MKKNFFLPLGQKNIRHKKTDKILFLSYLRFFNYWITRSFFIIQAIGLQKNISMPQYFSFFVPKIQEFDRGDNRQKGVSVVIAFFIMLIILAVVLSISTILTNEIKIISGLGNSVVSYYAVDSGIEKTLYFDRKQILAGSNRGFCNICNSCNDSEGGIPDDYHCNGLAPNFTFDDCTLTPFQEPSPLAPPSCDVVNCRNCRLDYTSSWAGDNYTISATTPDVGTPNFNMSVQGSYKDIQRKIELH